MEQLISSYTRSYSAVGRQQKSYRDLLPESKSKQKRGRALGNGLGADRTSAGLVEKIWCGDFGVK